MIRILAGLFFSLLSFATYAAVAEDAQAVVELPPPDATGLVAFLVVTVAMIAGYVWWIAKKERARKLREGSKS